MEDVAAAEGARFRAWDCDANAGIAPEDEPAVFEEIADMQFPFEGIPTVPPRKDMSHMVRCAMITACTDLDAHTDVFRG